MTVLAHIGGLPVEELLPLAYGATALLAGARLLVRRRIK